jgi:hypothetical protein
MKTTIDIDGGDFLLNGRPTYPGVEHQGRRVEGLLMNSRMIQAIFDDEEPRTRGHWVYPDSGVWDPERNTDEFCRALPEYRRHGLLAVTVGLQGGGSIYTPPIYEQYRNSAFAADGSLKEAYMQRLRRVLQAADEAGMVVIVNYFYWRQEQFLNADAFAPATENATAWLLDSGFGNILVDLRNEIHEGDGLMQSRGIPKLLQIVRGTTRNGRRLLVGTSTHPCNHLPDGAWSAEVDFFMPHGNDSQAPAWRAELAALKSSAPLAARPRPICCNEDSTDLQNMEVCVDAHCSWGYFDQGYGSGWSLGKFDWSTRGREGRYEQLSGYQTLPVHWGINTDHKRAFFDRLKQITSS